MRFLRRTFLLVLLWPTLACADTVTILEPTQGSRLWPAFDGAEEGRDRLRLRLTQVADGFNRPTDIQAIPDAPGQFAILEKSGQAWRVDVRTRKATRWFRMKVLTRSEQGLLGIAFHPRFSQNGRFFVHASVRKGQRKLSQISEWRAAGRTKSRAAKTRVLLEEVQPWPNHNAGQLAFGPDGMLYIGLGDGGSGNDPLEAGQNANMLLGAMLRIDVDSGARPYGIPPDNPYVGQADARPEIWAIGLRNPWRFSFAPDGRLIAADVGQNRWEEITFVGRGDNLGWNVREGAACFRPAKNCVRGKMRDPFYVYGRREGVSVTGGYVYTGQTIPSLRGRYVFGDFASGRLWAIPVPTKDRLVKRTEALSLGRWGVSPSAFGLGHDGELYVLDFAEGGVYRLEPEGARK